MWIKEGKRIIRKSYGNYSNLVESREGDLIMTKSWRPENWDKIKPHKQSKGVEGISEPNFDYGVEAGADAMLKALRDIGAPLNQWVYIGKKMAGRGKLVFIPNILDIEGE